MSKKILFNFFILLILNHFSLSTIILPFTHKLKAKQKTQSYSSPYTSYFSSHLDNTIYTKLKVYKEEIDFHISMERYPMYISDNIYKKIENINPNNNTPKKEKTKLYSLDQIGINRASLINKTIIVKSNISSENEIKEINIFRTRKFINATESVKEKMGYASEEAEIGFNIVRGSQYIYVEETENDIDNEEIKDDYEKDKQREKAYEEMIGKRNKTKNDSYPAGYDPMHEYNPDPEDFNSDKNKPYSEDDLEEIYGENYKKNISNKNNNKNDNNNENERYVGNGLFKEESANFISQLKKRDKINSYAFSIKYNNDGGNNDENGEIIIGDLPHEYAPDKYKSENYFFDSVTITKEPPFNWHFVYEKCLVDNDVIDKKNMVKFSIDFGFIKGNTQLKNYLEQNFFNKKENTCYKNSINDYDTYYCTKDSIKNFKPIIFELHSKYCPVNINSKFEFTYEDLFVKDNTNDNIYYFQIVFNGNGLYSNMIFGKPLFKKYQMVFDQDRKTYGFYVQSNSINNMENNADNSNSSKISWGLVFVLIIISLVLLFIIHKLINKLPRRLKANELEENFSYESNSKYNEINTKDSKNKLYEIV